MPCSLLSRIFVWIASLAVGLCLPAPALGQPAFRTPQFVATAIGFKALHETHWNWLGSDEVYALLYDFTDLHLRRTATFGDVDAGESRSFAPPDSCIAPQPSCSRGSAGLAFGVALYEQDQPPFQFCHGSLDPSPATPEEYEGKFDALGGNCDDDLIGRAKIKLSQADLVALLPTVGASVDATVPVTGGAGRYEFTYRITRLQNAINIPPIGPPVEIAYPISLQVVGAPGMANLTWTGATAASVDIFRNGGFLKKVPNNGSYVDPVPPGSYTYRVCNTGTTVCSADVGVTVS